MKKAEILEATRSTFNRLLADDEYKDLAEGVYDLEADSTAQEIFSKARRHKIKVTPEMVKLVVRTTLDGLQQAVPA